MNWIWILLGVIIIAIIGIIIIFRKFTKDIDKIFDNIENEPIDK